MFENTRLYHAAALLWRKTLLKWFRALKKRKEEKYWSERMVHRGRENKDKTFYIVRRRDMYCGICSHILSALAHIDEETAKGRIPVVDLQNSFNIYLTPEQVGKVNAWEYYFKQPMGYSLEDVKKSKNVIIGSYQIPLIFSFWNEDTLAGKTGELQHWRKLAQKYLVLSDDARKSIEEARSRLFGEGEKILGVKCRGTDYTNGKPKGHPIQPTPAQALQKAEEIYREHHCTKVFLATEDEAFYTVFKERFGENLIVNKSDYVTYQGGSMGEEEYNHSAERREAGMEYLISTYLLSQCQCLCAGCVSGTAVALILSKGYEYSYFFCLGLYD